MTVKLTYKISNNGVVYGQISEKIFENVDKAWQWVRNQDSRPWLSISVVDVVSEGTMYERTN